MERKDYKKIAEIIDWGFRFGFTTEQQMEIKKRVTTKLVEYFKKQQQHNQFSERQFLKTAGWK